MREKIWDFNIKREHYCYLFVCFFPRSQLVVLPSRAPVSSFEEMNFSWRGVKDMRICQPFEKPRYSFPPMNSFMCTRSQASERFFFFCFFCLFFNLLSQPPFARAASWQAHKMVLRLLCERRLYFCFSLPFLMALRNTCQSA